MNHVHKDTRDLVSVIITIVTNISGGDTVFYDGVKTSDLLSRARVIKHLHGRIIFDAFEKCYREGNLWRGPIVVISFIIVNQIFVHLYRHRGCFLTNILINQSKQSILMTMVLG